MVDILDVTLSSTDKNGTTTLSNGNLTVTMTTATTGNIRATHGKTTGKWYWEIKYTGHDYFFVGIANMKYPIASPDYSGTSGNALNIRAFYVGTGAKFPENVAYSSRLVVGDVIGVALNLDEGKFGFYINGKSQGVSHTNILTMGEVYPFIKSQSTTSKVITVNFGATPFDYDIPYGFYSYDGRQSKWHDKFLISSEEKYYSVRSESYSQDTVIPTMTNNITPLGKAFSISEYSTDRGAWRSFDKTQTTYASRDGAGMIGHLGYEFDIAIAIGKYSVQSGTADSSTLQALPKDWIFESSDDGVNWNVLDTQTNQAWTSAYTDKEYYIDKRKIGKYKMYRLNWSTTNGWRYAIVGELKMYQYTSSLVRELSHALDVNFIKYGMNKNDPIDLNHSVSNIQHVVEDIQSLGLGKVFKQKIDTTKIPIKKASIT